MKTLKVEKIIEDKSDCPIPLEVIPNNMGINLVSVDSISWNRQNDGQLISLSIDFIPEPNSIDIKTNFETELLNLINRHVDKGLSKANLVSKMEYVTKSCHVS
jgi:hypothetical protein